MKLLALLLSLVGLTSTVRAFDLGPIPNGFGVNIHFTQEVPGELDMIRAAGFGLVRMDLTWQNIEKAKGEYDFSEYDKLLDGVEKRGMKIILIIDYTNLFYDDGLSVHTDDGRAGYANFAAAAAKRYKGRPVIFEIYNEPNIRFWHPTPNADDYAKMALLACQQMRDADPNCTIIGPALAGVEELDFLETCFQAGLLKYWNAVSVHPYRQTAPESVESDYRNIRALIRKYADPKQDIPIVSGEWGFSDAWASFDRDKQAKYLARQFLTNLANDIPLSIYYDWRDDGTDPKEPEHHFGLVEHEPTGDPTQPFKPKPAYFAAKTVMQELKGLNFNKQLVFDDPNIHLLLFGEKNDLKLVAWTTAEVIGVLKWPAKFGSFRCVDLEGVRQPLVQPDENATTLKVTSSPIFLQPDLPNLHLWTLASWSRVPLDFSIHSYAAASVKGIIRNYDDLHPLTLVIEPALVAEEKVSIPAGLAGVFTSKWLCDRLAIYRKVKISIRFEDGWTFSQYTSSSAADSLAARFIPLDERSGLVSLENRGRVGGTLDAAVSIPPNPEMNVTLTTGVNQPGISKTLHFNRPSRFPATATIDFAVQDTLGSKEKALLAYTPLQSTLETAAVSLEGNDKIDATATLERSNLALGQEVIKSAALTYQFQTGWKYICIKPAKELLPIDGKPVKLGVWVCGIKSKNLLRMRFIDSTGQVFQPDGGRLNFEGWKYVEFKMDGTSGGFWNGAKDGKIHYPIKIETLLLIDNDSRSPNQGKIYFAAPCLYYDVK